MGGIRELRRIAPVLRRIARFACSARSPFEKTTMLWRTRGDCTFSGDGASFVSGESSASAALPSYSLNWLHAFRLRATDESGCACR